MIYRSQVKNKQGRLMRAGLLFILAGLVGGCVSTSSDNAGQIQSYASPLIEAEWVRNGEPIEYDGAKWYPANDYEVLQDSEVFQIGEYKDVQIFVAKIDTKPYERIYTKFDKNKFRYWERRDND